MTIREKEEWISIMTKKIQLKIEQIWALNPGAKNGLRRKAWDRAIVDLGLSDIDRELNEAEESAALALDGLKNRLADAYSYLGADLGHKYERRTDMEKTPRSTLSTLFKGYREIVDARARVILPVLQAEDPVGKQVNALEEELSNIKEAVWIASSPKAIAKMWQEMTTRLNLNVTQTQLEALRLASGVEDDADIEDDD